MPGLDLDGAAVRAQIDKAAENTLEASGQVGSDHSGSAELSLNRRWTNGWDVTAYAKAWWGGHEVVNTAGGVKVRKTF